MGCGCGAKAARAIRRESWKVAAVAERGRLEAIPEDIQEVSGPRLKAARALHLELSDWLKTQDEGPEKTRFVSVLGAFARDVTLVEQYLMRKV